MAEGDCSTPGNRVDSDVHDPRGELVRHIVLPAGNLRTAITQHLDENGRGLDRTTLHLLAATRDILGDISRKGADIAVQPERVLPDS